MTDTTFKPAADPVELTRLAEAAKAPAMRLALRMYDDLEQKTKDDATALVDRGWNVAIEFAVDGFGQPFICLVCIGPGPESKRKLLANIAQGSPTAAN